MSGFPGTLSPIGTSLTNDVHSLNPSMLTVIGWSMWMGPLSGTIMNLNTHHQVLVPHQENLEKIMEAYATYKETY